MSLISFTPVTDGTTAVASGVNTPFSTIYNDYNGNITDANIASAAAINGSKLASNSVTSSQINFGGSGAGVWWQEIGRTTLGSNGDVITVSFTAKKYLMVKFAILNSGQLNGKITFNSDTGSNYAEKISTDAGAFTTNTSIAFIDFDNAATSTNMFSTMFIVNIATSEKLTLHDMIGTGGTGAATQPYVDHIMGKWANTASQITSLTLTNTGTGDYATGSEIVVLGHD